MITLKDFMEVADYRITEGSDYTWDCYGSNAYRFSSWNQAQDGFTVEVVLDTRTQKIYEFCAMDYMRNYAYRWQDPDVRDAYQDEARRRNANANQAWDDINYVDLEVEDDILEKARAIVCGDPVDTRVKVPLDLPDEALFQLMTIAHERDITLNQLAEQILRDEIARRERLDNEEVSKPKKKKKKKHDKD